MIIKPERKKGRLIIVTDSEEYDLTLYSSKPKHFYVADHADEHIAYLGTELSGCRDEITRLQAERDAMREQLDAIDKYLDIGTSDTSIHQNSVMHREVKALLGPY